MAAIGTLTLLVALAATATLPPAHPWALNGPAVHIVGAGLITHVMQRVGRNNTYLTAVTATVIVIGTELVQTAVGRSAEWADITWGIAGIACGLITALTVPAAIKHLHTTR